MIKITNKKRFYIIVTLATCALTLFSGNNLLGKGRNMDSLLKFNSFVAKNSNLSILNLSQEVRSLFAVPIENAVGTNDLNNAITLLRFNDVKKEVNYEQKLKDFLKYVEGGDLSFLPVFSKDVIGYAQSRRFILFNLRENTFKKYSICNMIEESISKVAVIDVEKNRFIFEIESFIDKIAGVSEPDIILKLIDLNLDQNEIALINLGEEKVGEKYLWSFQKNIIFIYRNPNIEAVDLNFKNIEHPLVKLFNKQKENFQRIEQMYIHPSLPFAIIVGTGKLEGNNYKVWIATWRNERESQLVPIIKDSYSNFEFSPDGKWVILRENVKGAFQFILASVDPKYPYFIGSPTILSGEVKSPWGTAWISNPLSYLVSDGGRMIYKWNIDSN